MSRTDKYKAGLRKDKRLAVLQQELQWSPEEHKLAEVMLGTWQSLHHVPGLKLLQKPWRFGYSREPGIQDRSGSDASQRSDGCADMFTLYSTDWPAAFGLHKSM